MKHQTVTPPSPTHPPPCPPTAKPTIAYATPTPSTPPTPLPAPPLAHACLPAPPSRPSANYPLSCQRWLRKLITVDKSNPSQTATHPPQPQPSSSRPIRRKKEQRKSVSAYIFVTAAGNKTPVRSLFFLLFSARPTLN